MLVEDNRSLANILDLVSFVFCNFNDEFTNLKDELEEVYRRSGEPDPIRLAFKDALYTLICERYE